MSDTYIDFLDDPRPGRQQGDLGQNEEWWAERQEALERAGYMLRPRYRPGWTPSWAGTDKFYLDFEDGQPSTVSMDNFPSFNRAHGLQHRLVMDATRMSDGKYVMLKSLSAGEGPYELQINKIFSEEPLVSDPRNHCARLLDVVELPNDPPIMVHAHLRPFYTPRFQTYGEFVAFFEQISEVGITVRRPKVDRIAYPIRVSILYTKTMSRIGNCPPINTIQVAESRHQRLYVGKYYARSIKHVSEIISSHKHKAQQRLSWKGERICADLVPSSISSHRLWPFSPVRSRQWTSA